MHIIIITMCLAYGIVDKDNDMHIPSLSLGTTLLVLLRWVVEGYVLLFLLLRTGIGMLGLTCSQVLTLTLSISDSKIMEH